MARSHGLAARLLVGQTLVLLAGAITAGLVALVVGPPIFHQHLLQAGHEENSPELVHIEMAYRDASLISLGLGLVISLLAATAVTWLLTRRLRPPMRDLTHAARELSRGHYTTRVPAVGTGTELDTLAIAFNTMAARLEGIEDTRRRMLSDLAHELRTPIATLAAYHEGLHDGVTEPGPESYEVLTEQTRRLSRLADDIEEVSTAEEGRLELDLGVYPVSSILQTAADAYQDQYAERGVSLTTDLTQAGAAQVAVDRQRLGQVLTNLLSNALRHTPPGGEVSLAAHQDQDEAVIVVTDTGDGIPAAQLQHVFERFYRGDAARTRDRSGSGIGLTISRAIVDAHGGSIAAASNGPGHGACFTVRLPLAAGRSVGAGPAGAVPAHQWGHTRSRNGPRQPTTPDQQSPL